MNFTLTRSEYRQDGIFSDLVGDTGVKFRTLEHAYPVEEAKGPEAFMPKIPAGVYTCILGSHRLDGMDADFYTFEITGVQGHAGLLFHWGNFDKDSEGCVLVGEFECEGEEQHMITLSRKAFDEFMSLQNGCDQFTLTVEG